ncbi:hypothetical protein GMOD_00004916 [Pyrenophora seminiperda CCB06]|uniref:Uncharacterized protein n=1 Tax=Pyrenophora seminiperda CCB06 TaxID=1302712 RepID=A0A3M7MHT3_9PLEO|nr:hypothetical protein GMOD_00004916 [Pyrenophora seminiperda CCB06]
MALSPTCNAKKQSVALWTQETGDDNGCFGWFWECIGWKKSSQDTLERRPNLSDQSSFGCSGTSGSTVGSTKASVIGSSASHVSCSRSTYRCYYKNCKETRTAPALIDWHVQKDHKGGRCYTATGQGEGSRDPANPRQDAATATASGLNVTDKPKVLSILSCKAGGHVDAFVQSEEQGTTKQWPQLYSLAEFHRLNNAPVALEEFLKSFSS